jgi:uncharacterized protein YjbK
MMAQNDYIIKSMMNEDSYKKIISTIKKDDAKFDIQTNHYFDTDISILTGSNCSLRVRVKDENYVLILRKKKKFEQFQDYSVNVDKEFLEEFKKSNALPPLTGKNSPDTDSKKSEIYREIVNLVKNYSLYNFLSICTVRFKFRYKNCLIFVDKTEYLGITDYEIELHTEDKVSHADGEGIFNTFLKNFVISYKPAPKKIDRAYARLHSA